MRIVNDSETHRKETLWKQGCWNVLTKNVPTKRRWNISLSIQQVSPDRWNWQRKAKYQVPNVSFRKSTWIAYLNLGSCFGWKRWSAIPLTYSCPVVPFEWKSGVCLDYASNNCFSWSVIPVWRKGTSNIYVHKSLKWNSEVRTNIKCHVTAIEADKVRVFL